MINQEFAYSDYTLKYITIVEKKYENQKVSEVNEFNFVVKFKQKLN